MNLKEDKNKILEMLKSKDLELRKFNKCNYRIQ